MRRDQGDDHAGHHAHARHRGRRRRRRAGRRVGLSSGPPPVAFAGGALDRAAADRARAAEVAREAGARAVLVGPGSAAPEPVPLGADDVDRAIFLGRDAEGPLFAVPGRADDGLAGLRELAATLPGDRLGLLAYAVAMNHWAFATRFCGRCGAPTAPRDGGHLRVCARGHQHHPRTDPVVIMLVTRGDEVLLGRQPAWPAGRYSALAGFVEPGEALETAVAREVREEAGVEVAAVRYVASQPWPFPGSLMLGFEAVWAGGEPAPQDDELEDVRWFARGEVAAAAGADVAWEADAAPRGLLLPPTSAIARTLLDRWLAAGSA